MFKEPGRQHYSEWLKDIHRNYKFDWYMEIGCRTGTSFAEVRSNTIAVDPFFRVTQNVISSKRQLHIFQMESDAFFGMNFLAKLDINISFSFLDGMHLFEYLLRDFINTEKNASRAGVIALHDCCPTNVAMTTRDLDKLPKGAWTGDVWKLVPIIQKYRPDLIIEVINCRPTGLVLVSGLDPENNSLIENYDRIIAEYRDMEFVDFGVEKFYDSFEYLESERFSKDRANLWRGIEATNAEDFVPKMITP